MLQPNTPRYLATAVYDVTACDGDFRMHFERFTCPTQQINGTVVSVPLATQPFTQRICFTALESLVTCTPTDCAEPANVVAAPASGTIDARQPHPPHDASPAARQGIGGAGSAVSLTLGVVAAARDCFGFCETAADADLGVNDIANIVEAPAGTYGISLDRPITASAVTTLSYGSDVVTYFSHPGNTNGDGDADADDVVSLVAYLDGDETPPFGLYSTDADHSGAANPADLLRLVDLLLGADLFEPTLHTSLPTSTGCP